MTSSRRPARPTPHAVPCHADGRFSHATDNGFSTDRYAVHFTDGLALVVWTNGSHSVWSDDDASVRHVLGVRVRWADLPFAVRQEVWRRCLEWDEGPQPDRG